MKLNLIIHEISIQMRKTFINIKYFNFISFYIKRIGINLLQIAQIGSNKYLIILNNSILIGLNLQFTQGISTVYYQMLIK